MQKNLGRVSIVPKGVWNESASYARLDAVVYNGGSWLARKPSKGITPAEGAYWQVLAAKGAKGDRGEQGKGFLIKGHYDTLEELKEAVPKPETGDAYNVGAEHPYDTYIYDGKTWVNNGPLQGPKGEPGSVESVNNVPPDSNGNIRLIVGTSDIAGGSVTRAKLATDAAYSPTKIIKTAEYAISASDGGSTLWTNGSQNFEFSLSQSTSANMPIGVEIAVVLILGTEATIEFTEGIRLAMPGFKLFLKNAKLRMSGRGEMVALKKIASDATSGDLWLVQGLAEVVT